MTMTRTTQTALTADPPIVALDGLTKRYGESIAVNELSFVMRPGTITGFVGPNGAGKTTTIRMLLGLIRADAGERNVCDGDLSRVGALIDGPAFHPQLSARRNLRLLATLGSIDSGRVDHVLDQVMLTERADDAVRTYSLGMRQRLGIAAALLSDPEVLFLDEPTNGLDPQGILDMRALLRGQAAAGKAILVSSHLLSEIEHICDHLVVIRNGTRLYFGPIAELERQQRAELVVRPEEPGDLDRLTELLGDHGYRSTPENSGIRVIADPDHAGGINRLAFQAGIVLARLHDEQESLEATFLRMMSGSAS
ncbi:MAG: ABC transporter ATP-binding protein [Acidimicrobiales bacterium]